MKRTMQTLTAVLAVAVAVLASTAPAAAQPQLRHIPDSASAAAAFSPVRTGVESSTQAAALAAHPVSVQPRANDGWISLTTRVCGTSRSWMAQRALNGGAAGLYLGRWYRIDCSLTGTPAPAAPAPASSTWLYPIANSPCGRNFGQPRPGNDGRYGTSDDYAHQGVDIPASTGTVVRAARGGTVIFAGWNGSAGQQVQINHGGGWVTKSNHLSYVNVRYGQSVGQGQHIGSVGSTGRSTGPHLHVEMWLNGRLQNPTGVLAPRC